MLNLGTKKHRDKYFDGIDNLENMGCFAMTELHHGKFYFYNSVDSAYFHVVIFLQLFMLINSLGLYVVQVRTDFEFLIYLNLSL